MCTRTWANQKRTGVYDYSMDINGTVLVIVDPLNYYNNVAKSTYKYVLIEVS